MKTKTNEQDSELCECCAALDIVKSDTASVCFNVKGPVSEQARSIKYQIPAARPPLAKETEEFDFKPTPVDETLVCDRGGPAW